MGCLPQNEAREECMCGHQRMGHSNLRPGKGPEPCLNCHCEGFTSKTPKKR
jgi:hypothetical protein